MPLDPLVALGRPAPRARLELLRLLLDLRAPLVVWAQLDLRVRPGHRARHPPLLGRKALVAQSEQQVRLLRLRGLRDPLAQLVQSVLHLWSLDLRAPLEPLGRQDRAVSTAPTALLRDQLDQRGYLALPCRRVRPGRASLDPPALPGQQEPHLALEQRGILA